MPRVSRAEAEKNRENIERVSSRLIRERGLGVSVADLMNAAGLTHGGFYGHFQSKDELLGIACARAFDEAAEHWEKRAADADPYTSIVDAYLSLSLRAKVGASCPMAGLATDVAREDAGKPIRDAFTDGFERLVGILSRVQPAPTDADDDRAKALAQIATMVGALVLARATKGAPVSGEIMDAARQRLLE